MRSVQSIPKRFSVTCELQWRILHTRSGAHAVFIVRFDKRSHVALGTELQFVQLASSIFMMHVFLHFPNIRIYHQHDKRSSRTTFYFWMALRG
ncbi:hypothetical protein AAHA92_04386 [Salvia divinorum]|uniref:Uncharacterized protein n=1 Tax=Salvia divinorum TaxID=28513 RepID=A0ABD1HZ19_SALDI